MEQTKRVLRSSAHSDRFPVPPPAEPSPKLEHPVKFVSLNNINVFNQQREIIQILSPSSKLPGLNSSELKLLRKKQSHLLASAANTLESLPDAHMRNALDSSLIFAQKEAGSAVCIHSEGWILTCSHCCGDTEEEWQQNRFRWLLLYTGLAVQAECRAWDDKRDLALLKVVTVESSDGTMGDVTPVFPFARLAMEPPRYLSPVICIGQPAADDLESASSRKTGYNTMEVSKGRFRGMVAKQNQQDNADIGALKHDAWTYWGHSGAPLFTANDTSLIGLHSSWDERTAMRHGIPLVAINSFLEKHLPQALPSWDLFKTHEMCTVNAGPEFEEDDADL